MDENEIVSIEKQYSRLVDYRVGKVTLDQFRTVVSPPIPDALVEGKKESLSIQFTNILDIFLKDFLSRSTKMAIIKSTLKKWFVEFRRVVVVLKLNDINVSLFIIFSPICLHSRTVFTVIFKIFDRNCDGKLDQNDVQLMVDQMLLIRFENSPILMVNY